MKSFKSILLVCEARNDATAILKRASMLAEHDHAALTVIDVLKELPAEMLRAVTTVSPAELQEIAVRERRQELERLVAPFTTQEVPIATKVLVGTPFLEFIREVLRNRHDLVMKAAEGERRRLLFGSTDLHLLRKCPCPVWVGKPGRRIRYARILAAVDPDPSDDKRHALNARIMELAMALAHLDQAELHVVHAWDVVGEPFLRSLRSPLSDTEVDRLVRRTLDDHLLGLDQLLRRYDASDLKCKKHLLRGDPGELIPKLINEQQIDLVVMGTVARTGIPGLIIGNTAEKVLDRVSCSVLAIKPEGFVTPVTLE